MSSETNKAMVIEFAELINQGDLSAIDRYLSPNFYNHYPKAGEKNAQEIIGELISGLLSASPDLNVTIANFEGNGDSSTFEMTVNGTHKNNLWGAPGSGKQASWTSSVTARFENNRFAFCWQDLPVPEILAALRQIDMVPPPDKMDQPMPYPIVVPEFLIKVLFTGQAADRECSHLDLIQVTEPSTDVCEKCVELGDIWPALRMCLICGFIGCCDTSKNKHMKQHFEQTGHPIFRSVRLDEGWLWCYEDNAFFSKDVLEQHKA